MDRWMDFVLLSDRASTSTDAVEDMFSAVDTGALRVDSSQDVPRLLYRIFKHQYSARQAEIWCLKRELPSLAHPRSCTVCPCGGQVDGCCCVFSRL